MSSKNQAASSLRPSGLGMTEGLRPSTAYVLPQIPPTRVHAFDRIHFPLSWPFFEALFAADGLFGAVMRFEPDQVMEIVSLGKAFHGAGAMLVDALNQVAGDTDVKRSVLPIGDHVGVEGLCHARGFPGEVKVQ